VRCGERGKAGSRYEMMSRGLLSAWQYKAIKMRPCTHPRCTQASCFSWVIWAIWAIWAIWVMMYYFLDCEPENSACYPGRKVTTENSFLRAKCLT
jgi:hypothetical protein